MKSEGHTYLQRVLEVNDATRCSVESGEKGAFAKLKLHLNDSLQQNELSKGVPRRKKRDAQVTESFSATAPELTEVDGALQGHMD